MIRQKSEQYRYGEVILESAEQLPPSARRSEGPIVPLNLTKHGSATTLTNANAWLVGKSKYVEVEDGALLGSTVRVSAGIYKVMLESHYNVLQHGIRVGKLAGQLGERLDLSASLLGDIVLGARVHDISITLLEEMIRKPDDFTADELGILKQHPQKSVEMIKNMKFGTKYNIERVTNCVLYHHEHFDGSGYPFGLKGKEIPLEARIVFIADAYDAMRSWRPHQQPVSPGADQVQTERRLQREPLSEEQALRELRAHAGRRFDPELVDLFSGLIGKN